VNGLACIEAPRRCAASRSMGFQLALFWSTILRMTSQRAMSHQRRMSTIAARRQLRTRRWTARIRPLACIHARLWVASHPSPSIRRRPSTSWASWSSERAKGVHHSGAAPVPAAKVDVGLCRRLACSQNPRMDFPCCDACAAYVPRALAKSFDIPSGPDRAGRALHVTAQVHGLRLAKLRRSHSLPQRRGQ
jgi:hypothetical protein